MLGLIGMGFNVNIIALLLLAIGAVLVIYELYSPGLGAVGFCGLLTLAVGVALLLTRPPGPLVVAPIYFEQLFWSAAAVAGTTSALFGFIFYKAARAVRWRTRLFQEAPDPGARGRVVQTVGPAQSGIVWVRGEEWQARSSHTVEAGKPVRIIRREGLLLHVEPVEESSAQG